MRWLVKAEDRNLRAGDPRPGPGTLGSNRGSAPAAAPGSQQFYEQLVGFQKYEYAV